MFDGATIRRMSEEAARKSRENHEQPMTFHNKETDGIGLMPFLGDRVPRGWKVKDAPVYRASAFAPKFRGHRAIEVDNSGFGSTSEPALTAREFIDLIDFTGNTGYGIVESGAFQVVIACFERGHSL